MNDEPTPVELGAAPEPESALRPVSMHPRVGATAGDAERTNLTTSVTFLAPPRQGGAE